MQQRPQGYGTSIGGGGGAHHLPNGITTDICELRIIARKKSKEYCSCVQTIYFALKKCEMCPRTFKLFHHYYH